MSINWNWKDKIGELEVSGIHRDIILNIYEGNAVMIFLYEYEEDGKELYQMYNFICDVQHLRRCVANGDGYFADWKELRLHKWSKNIETIASICARAGVRVVFDIKARCEE